MCAQHKEEYALMLPWTFIIKRGHQIVFRLTEIDSKYVCSAFR